MVPKLRLPVLHTYGIACARVKCRRTVEIVIFAIRIQETILAQVKKGRLCLRKSRVFPDFNQSEYSIHFFNFLPRLQLLNKSHKLLTLL